MYYFIRPPTTREKNLVDTTPANPPLFSANLPSAYIPQERIHSSVSWLMPAEGFDFLAGDYKIVVDELIF